jgi:ATP/maltotriose-dependent transcriptional regulator MalT/DNA-binding SARP family transcriptional activator
MGESGHRRVPLLEAKLTLPAVSDRLVARPRLDTAVAQLLEEHRVVGVWATAGAGKTTAVRQAVSALELPVAWLTLDPTDTAPGRLLVYLEAAIRCALPDTRAAATEALAAGVMHSEAAGLLAQSVPHRPAVLVLDELERIAGAPAALDVLSGLIRYLGPETRVVLVGRREVELDALSRIGYGALGRLGEEQLAFNADEAEGALALHGLERADPHSVVEATGGWVTGVLFEAWRSARHVAGIGGEADPLHGYLAAHIVDQLDDADREFLVTTSVLDEVTPSRAAALGEADAAARLASLRKAHLPASWSVDRRVLRCHSRFREYLRDCLERRGEAEVRRLALLHGRLLVREGDDEDAVEELLRAGAVDDARASAERAIGAVVERGDFAIAERWLAALGAAAPTDPAAFPAAELMLALGQGDFRRAERVADTLAEAGQLEGSTCAAFAAWTYAVMLRVDDMQRVIALAGDGEAAKAVRYALPHLAGGPPPERPPLTGGPFDALVLASDVGYGRFDRLIEESATRWIDAVSGARRVAVLRATGQTQRALALYQDMRARGQATVQLEAWAGPEVMIDAGREAEARDAIARGRDLARRCGAPVYEWFNDVAAAKLELRLKRDTAAARAALDRVEAHGEAAQAPWLRDPLDTWYGLALLLEGDDEGALARLRRAVESMGTGDRMLELPTAAVYLAEAQWRAGDEDAADAAADLALYAAHRQGANHVLLQALRDFPAVVSRRLDAEPGADSPWHDIGRALIAQGAVIGTAPRAAVELVEFGRRAILVDGQEARPRIAKTYELLAYLVTRRDGAAAREELLEVLFEGRVDDSTRAYLRQAVRWLRRVMPHEGAVVFEAGRLSIGDDVLVTSESTVLESRLAEAARLRGEDRLAATLDALQIFDRGEYLPGSHLRWVDERRERLVELATDARYEAAELAFAAGSLDRAEQLAAEVLRVDPFREAAWRLTMRVANALGDHDGVIRAYQRCEAALAQVRTEPAASTRELLGSLRR